MAFVWFKLIPCFFCVFRKSLKRELYFPNSGLQHLPQGEKCWPSSHWDICMWNLRFLRVNYMVICSFRDISINISCIFHFYKELSDENLMFYKSKKKTKDLPRSFWDITSRRLKFSPKSRFLWTSRWIFGNVQ